MSDLNLDPSTTAIVVIDLQKGILAMPGSSPYTPQEVLARAVQLLDAGRATGAQAVLVRVGRSPDGRDALQTPVDNPWRSTAPPPPDWAELHPDLNPQPGDVLILKRQWGAFYGTDLDLQLRRRGIRTVILCGIATEFGVESTARAAHEHGYAVVLAHDAMTGRAAHQNSIQNIFPLLGRVRSTEEIVKALGKA
ncbi:MAG: hydrolase [Acidobacteriaceae bacterium]